MSKRLLNFSGIVIFVAFAFSFARPSFAMNLRRCNFKTITEFERPNPIPYYKDISYRPEGVDLLAIESGHRTEERTAILIRTNRGREVVVFSRYLTAGGHPGMMYIVQELLNKVSEGKEWIETATPMGYGGEIQLSRGSTPGFDHPLHISQINPSSGMMHTQGLVSDSQVFADVMNGKFPGLVHPNAVQVFDPQNVHLVKVLSDYVNLANEKNKETHDELIKEWEERNDPNREKPVLKKPNFRHDIVELLKCSAMVQSAGILALQMNPDHPHNYLGDPAKLKASLERNFSIQARAADVHLAVLDILKKDKVKIPRIFTTQLDTPIGKRKENPTPLDEHGEPLKEDVSAPDPVEHLIHYFKELKKSGKPPSDTSVQQFYASYWRFSEYINTVNFLMGVKDGKYSEEQQKVLWANTQVIQLKKPEQEKRPTEFISE